MECLCVDHRHRVPSKYNPERAVFQFPPSIRKVSKEEVRAYNYNKVQAEHRAMMAKRNPKDWFVVKPQGLALIRRDGRSLMHYMFNQTGKGPDWHAAKSIERELKNLKYRAKSRAHVLRSFASKIEQMYYEETTPLDDTRPDNWPVRAGLPYWKEYLEKHDIGEYRD